MVCRFIDQWSPVRPGHIGGRLCRPALALHGLGFSFALREMLQLNGPHLVVSLGAFNLGVELGQIAFAAAVWEAMLWLALRAAHWQARVKTVVASGCIVVAALWAVERSQQILAMA
jgi:hypothetical protein